MKKLLISMFFITMIFIQKTDGFAWGLGMNIGYSAGKSRTTHENLLSKDRTWITTGNFSSQNWFGGIMMDTNVNKNDLIGFRGSIGAGVSSIDKNNYLRFNENNVLSFRLIQNENVRFWIGPQLGLHLDIVRIRQKINYGIPQAEFTPPITMSQPGTGYNLLVDMGLAVGANIKISEPVYFTIDGGFKYGVNFNMSHINYRNYLGRQGNLLHGYETFLNMGFLYRMGEEVQEKTENKDKG